MSGAQEPLHTDETPADLEATLSPSGKYGIQAPGTVHRQKQKQARDSSPGELPLAQTAEMLPELIKEARGFDTGKSSAPSFPALPPKKLDPTLLLCLTKK
ncbi:hypothetical protein Y1Q_0000150 [Alligator mississippiensis]|uniref:Uncharacterized protein n=1 Tax=Alligator mississippiensis TaxID=8496 RepID=A0A151MM23_ALLMI|nr:hypothetical protein Y1Q_0000150 [Alligator mississippiensis]